MSGSNKKLFRPSSPPPPPPPPPKPSKFSINFQKPFEDLTKSFSRLLETNAAATTTEPSPASAPAPSDLPPKLPPKKSVSKTATESELLSFLFLSKKAPKQQQQPPPQSQKQQPPPLPPRNPTSFVRSPKRPTIPSGANMTKSELFNLLFPPRMNNKTTAGSGVSGGGTSSTRERRQRHSSPIFLTQKAKAVVPKKVSIVEPPKTDGKNMTSKPPLASDLYSFFFHPRNKTTKIMREPRQFRSYIEEDGRSSSSGRAGQLSSFGNSRSCSNLMSTTTTTSGGRQNFGDLNYHSPQRGNSSLDDIWSTAPPTTNRQLATPLEPRRNDGPPKPPRARPPNAGPTSGSNKTNNSGTAAMTTVAARPSSAMPSTSSRQNLSLMTKRSVSMGSLNLNDFLTDGVQGVPGGGDLDLEDENAKECTICCEKEVDSVFIPCGHMCLCFDCANEYRSSKKDGACPICRAPSTGVFRTFSA